MHGSVWLVFDIFNMLNCICDFPLKSNRTVWFGEQKLHCILQCGAVRCDFHGLLNACFSWLDAVWFPQFSAVWRNLNINIQTLNVSEKGI